MFICPLMSLHFIPREKKYRILLKPVLDRVSFAVTRKVRADMFGVWVRGSYCGPGTMSIAHNKTFASLCSLGAWL